MIQRLLLPSLLCGVMASQAQPLHFDQSSVWTEELWRYEGLESHHLVYTMTVQGDTTIGGNSLGKIRRVGTATIAPILGNPPPPPMIIPIDEYAGAVRVDSAAGKWWTVLPGSTEEQLLYRFDLEVGEAVTGTYGDCSGAPVVTAIDEVWFNGRSHRRFILDNGFRHLIEGIGASSGLFGHLCQFFEEFSCLQAYSQGPEVWHVDGCEAVTTGINPAQADPEAWRTFPNPTSGRCYLGAEAAGRIVSVHDMTGTLVGTLTAGAGGELDLGSYAAGAYVLRMGTRRTRIVRT